jgi:hypothetical protein
MSTETESRIALGVNQQGQVWRSHTGHLFRWSEASQTWHSKAPDAEDWRDLHIRTALSDARTPFVPA